jgi:nucleotide-binding universal stress UspA family protein
VRLGGSDILVAVLGEDHAASTVAYAADVARERNARLTLLSVVPWMPVVMCPFALPYDPLALEEESARTLRTASQHVPQDVPVTLQLARGCVVRETVLRAASGGHDLIVLGGDHRRGVARRVIRRAGVPVVIVDDSARQPTALDTLPRPVGFGRLIENYLTDA